MRIRFADIFAPFIFIGRRTIILFLAAYLLSNWLINFDVMKLKSLNRVVPESMEDLVAFSLNPDSAKAGNLQKYIPFFKTAIESLSNKSAAARSMLGYCYFYLGDTQKAIKQYEEARGINPKFFWTYYNLGVIQFKQGKYAEAAVILEKALMCEPAETLMFINVSKIYKDLNYYAANQGYDTEKGLRNTYRDVHELLAKCYYHLKQYNRVLVILDNSGRLNLHDKKDLYYYSGLVELMNKNYEQALALFQQVLKDDPSRQGAYYYLGFCLKQIGRMDIADQFNWRVIPEPQGFDSFGKQNYPVRIF